MSEWDSDEALGSIESVLENFRDTIKDDGPITIGVMRGSPYLAHILKMLDDINNVKGVIIDNPNDLGELRERQRKLLVDNDEFIKFIAHDHYYIDRRFAEFEPEPLIKSNNKPWYQDHKQNRSKKSRRKL